MPWFRRAPEADSNTSVELSDADDSGLARQIAEMIGAGNFFAADPLRLEWSEQAEETLPWEIFRGRLLPAAQTRQVRTFHSWGIFRLEAGKRSEEPLIAVRLDRDAGQLYVTRAILCHVWEGYHAGDNVYLSREVARWNSELVGAIVLSNCKSLSEKGSDPLPNPLYLDQIEVETLEFAGGQTPVRTDCISSQTFRDELMGLLFRAVVGTSRLPITSLENPLPDYSLGRLGYFHNAGKLSSPMDSLESLINSGWHDQLSAIEEVKLLELLIRHARISRAPELARLVEQKLLALQRSRESTIHLFRGLFNEVALSPYTEFVDTFLIFLKELASLGSLRIEDRIDILGHLLRQNSRHLTAYDLVTFHHRGSNYPDALLLDAVLREVLLLAEEFPALFLEAAEDGASLQRGKRLRRRAFRQGLLLHYLLRDLPVPVIPTSPGENARVLPHPHDRVPEEQISDPAKRSRRLYRDRPTITIGASGSKILRTALADLAHSGEYHELGTALFLDRPLGGFKGPGEEDRTPLLSYVCYSAALAEMRFEQLLRLQAEVDVLHKDGPTVSRPRPEANVEGVPLDPIPGGIRRAGLSLRDATRVAGDFILHRTTRGSAHAFLELFDWEPLAKARNLFHDIDSSPLIVDAGYVGGPTDGTLWLYDQDYRLRLEIGLTAPVVYRSRADCEIPQDGLLVRRAWSPTRPGDGFGEIELGNQPIVIRPKA